MWSPHTVERSLQDSCLTFLRSACVMASLCYDVSVPQIKVSERQGVFSSGGNLEDLRSYIGLSLALHLTNEHWQPCCFHDEARVNLI